MLGGLLHAINGDWINKHQTADRRRVGFCSRSGLRDCADAIVTILEAATATGWERDETWRHH
jgi:hypothetical protein